MLKQNRVVLNHAQWNDQGRLAAEEVLQAVDDHSLETIRLSFADQHGVLRGKTIVAGELKSAFESGVTMTTTLLLKDTSHATVFPVWKQDAGFGHGKLTGASDFLLIPDPRTFRILPWSPHTGWMTGEIHETDGALIPFSSRHILRQAVNKLKDKNMELVTGLEVEFHVFRMDNANLRHDNAGRPEDPPETSLLTHGYQYLTESRYDEMEHVMDLIRRNAIALELPVRSMEAEFGPSQFEFTFRPAGALENADALVLFRSMVKQVCRRAGYHATFMCRPQLKSIMPSGWHLHQSVVDPLSGKNLFIPDQGQVLTRLGEQWVAGLLEHAWDACLLSTPTVNGYKRYQPHALAPDRVQWGRDNRGAMIRVITAEGDPASRIENRVGESAANPYLYMASQILCGLDGVERGLVAPLPVETPYDADVRRLPTNLGDAIRAFRESEFMRRALGDDFVDYYAHIKQAEWGRYLSTVSEWEHREYFSLF
jgi:glutamine synthetase